MRTDLVAGAMVTLGSFHAWRRDELFNGQRGVAERVGLIGTAGENANENVDDRFI